jgi:hypothetical protein
MISLDDGTKVAKLQRAVWTDGEHRTAARCARNYRESVNPRQYQMRKARQYGLRLWCLISIYAQTIKEVEGRNPDRCIAFVDGEAKRLIQQSEATYVAAPSPRGLVVTVTPTRASTDGFDEMVVGPSMREIMGREG